MTGEDLPDATGCLSPADLPADAHEHATLAALGLIEDSGRRRRLNGRLHIHWSITTKGRRLAPDLTADLERHSEPPSDEDIARVLQWVDVHGPAHGTLHTAAQQCAEALDWPSTHVERCLLWAEVNGFVERMDSA